MKFRSDFVTNSSSSSFVACGVLSQELAEFITDLLGGKSSSYAKCQVGMLQVDGDVVSVTTTLDSGDYHIFETMIDSYDGRTQKQRRDDAQLANTPQAIAGTFSAFLPDMTPAQKNRFVQLLDQAAAKGDTSAEVYVDETDSFECRTFGSWSFTSQPHGARQAYHSSAGRAAVAADSKQDWLVKYGHLLSKDPQIVFDGKLFAFSGFGHASEKEHPVVQKVMERGGLYRSKISGVTNYLVVDPVDSGEAKLRAVMEQREKGKFVQVILREDLEKALGMDTAAPAEAPKPQPAPVCWENAEAYDDVISFVLPEDYELLREFNDEGNECVRIVGEYYVDEDWERQHTQICQLLDGTVIRDQDQRPMHAFWVEAYQDKENVRYLVWPSKPEVMFMSIGLSMMIFGHELKMVALSMLVEEDDTRFLTLLSNGRYKEDAPQESLPQFERLLKAARALRVHGRPLELGELNAQMLLDALQPSYDGNKPIETGINLKFNIEYNGETTTYEYGSAPEPTISHFTLAQADPHEALYPHYNSLRSGMASTLGMLGVNVVVNATGTEYSFLSLRKELDTLYGDPEDGPGEALLAVYRRLIAADTAPYDLHEKAEQMIPLFRVDAGVFDPKHDRECELAEGLMHRAYMMSALRSFAWSLHDWCSQKDVQPQDLEYHQLQRIIRFISRRHWLNYDDSCCQGLCGCPDLHVYYVPDGASYADKQALLPSAEHLAQMDAIKQTFSGFDEISTTVHSLDALRRDLAYLLPAIETICAQLAQDRDRELALTGDEADILYAWCALALAAEGPFFTEDGPMNCWFVQRDDDIMDYQPVPRAPKAVASGEFEMKGTTLVRYKGSREEVQIPDGVQIIGSCAFEKCKSITDVRIPSSVHTIQDYAFRGCENLRTVHMARGLRTIEKNVFYDAVSLRQLFIPASVTRIAEYMVLMCNYFKCAHVEKDSYAERYCQQADIPYDYNYDGVPQVQQPEPEPEPEIPSYRLANVQWEDELTIDDGVLSDVMTQKSHLQIPEGVTEIGFSACGNLAITAVSLPSTLQKIGNSAFSECLLEEVVIPEGVTEIEEYAFQNCGFLRSVTLPQSLKILGQRVFDGCGSLKQIVIPDSVTVMGEGVFNDCIALEDVTLSANVERLPPHTFSQCTSLMNLRLPEGLKTLGTGCLAFNHWVQCLVVPASVTRIEPLDFASYHASNVRELVILGENCILEREIRAKNYSGEYLPLTVYAIVGTQSYEYLRYRSDLKLKPLEDWRPRDMNRLAQQLRVRVREGTKELGAQYFYSLESLPRYVDLPASVTAIESDTFLASKLAGVYIPDHVKQIGPQAFSGSDARFIRLPEGMTRLPTGVLNGGRWEWVQLPQSLKELEEGSLVCANPAAQVVIPPQVKALSDEAAVDVTNCATKFFITGKQTRITGDWENVYSRSVYIYAYPDSAARKDVLARPKLNYVELTEDMIPTLDVKQRLEQQYQRELALCRQHNAYMKAQVDAVVAVIRQRREAEIRRREEERKRREAELAAAAERKRQIELAQKRKSYDELEAAIARQEKIIAENKGWFGAQAKARKAAQEELNLLKAKMIRQFPLGKP